MRGRRRRLREARSVADDAAAALRMMAKLEGELEDISSNTRRGDRGAFEHVEDALFHLLNARDALRDARSRLTEGRPRRPRRRR